MIYLLTKLTSKPWLMEAEWFKVMTNIITRKDITSNLETTFAKQIEKRALSLKEGSKKELNFVEKRGNIGVLNITGPIVRYGGMMELSANVRSLETYSEEFKILENDHTIDTIVLNIDSPGGEAAGIAEFATYIRNSKKKVVAFIDDLGASAAYWIASATKEIYASQTAFVGSIGVVFTLVNDAKKLKKEGLEKIEIVSTQSPKKRPDISSDEGKNQIQTWADDLGKKFITSVAKYRRVSEDTVLEKFGQGDLLIADKAKDVGMIDGISTFEGLIKKLQKQGAKMSNSTMSMQDFKAQNPSLFDEIFKAGATAERERIQDIENLGNFTGYEEIVKNMKFDGKSTAEAVELAVFRAEREKKMKVKDEFLDDGKKAAALLAEAGMAGIEEKSQKPKASSIYDAVLNSFKGGK